MLGKGRQAIIYWPTVCIRFFALSRLIHLTPKRSVQSCTVLSDSRVSGLHFIILPPGFLCDLCQDLWWSQENWNDFSGNDILWAPHYLFHFVSFAGMVSSSWILYFGMPKNSTPFLYLFTLIPKWLPLFADLISIYTLTAPGISTVPPSPFSLFDTGM